jgi:hypothetical protein
LEKVIAVRLETPEKDSRPPAQAVSQGQERAKVSFLSIAGQSMA